MRTFIPSQPAKIWRSSALLCLSVSQVSIPFVMQVHAGALTTQSSTCSSQCSYTLRYCTKLFLNTLIISMVHQENYFNVTVYAASQKPKMYLKPSVCLGTAAYHLRKAAVHALSSPIYLGLLADTPELDLFSLSIWNSSSANLEVPILDSGISS